mgnify:CR=1 FL=1
MAEFLAENLKTIISIGSLLIGGIISLIKVFNKINKNTEDIKKLREDLEKEKNQNKDNYNKLNDHIVENFNLLTKSIEEKLNVINKLSDSLHEMRIDVNVIKNDIGTIKDRLDKLEEKSNF